MEDTILLILTIVGVAFVTTVAVVLISSGKPLPPMRMSPVEFFGTNKKENDDVDIK
jgi:hypothetical protein